MFIADSQVHLWKDETPDRPWPAGERERRARSGQSLTPFTYPECLAMMDEAGVNRVVIVPPSWEGDRVDYALEAAEKYPDRFGVMARIPLNQPAEARAMLRDWAKLPGIKGVRLTFHRGQEKDWMTDGTSDWYWDFAEQNNIPTMILAPSGKAHLGTIAARHPGLRLILDHMGIMAPTADEAVGPAVEETANLHIHPNIYVKVSAIPAYSTHPFPYENINIYARALIQKMGAERCFWGTDLSRMIETKQLNYRGMIEHFTKYMGLTDAELTQVMGAALCDCLNWPV